MKQYSLENIRAKSLKVAVQCDNLYSAIKVHNIFKQKGINWRDNSACMVDFDEDHAFALDDSEIDRSDLLFYGSIKFYKREGYTIITAEQFLNDNKEETMEKPYNSNREITYDMLISHPYFKTLSLSDLNREIGIMNYVDWKKIGDDIHSTCKKAQIIYDLIHKETIEQKKIIAFELKEVYPGSPKLGYIAKGKQIRDDFMFDINSSGLGTSNWQFTSYFLSRFWQPIYEEWIPKVGDWVYGWHSKEGTLFGTAWQVKKVEYGWVYAMRNNYCTNLDNIRKATKEEIADVQKPKEIILKLGSNNVEVKISKGKIEVRSVSIDITNLTRTYNYYNWTTSLEEWPVNIPKSIRCIQVGCDNEKNLFSLQELEQVINEYNKLNS